MPQYLCLLAVDGNYLGSDSKLDGGNWYSPEIIDFAVPSEVFEDSFAGITQNPDISVEISAAPYLAAVDGWTEATLTLLTTTDPELRWTRKLRITSYEIGDTITLTLADFATGQLEQLYPGEFWNADALPEIFTEHDGLPIPYAVGTAEKLPVALIDTNALVGPFVFGICRPAGATLLTLYRGGAIWGTASGTDLLDIDSNVIGTIGTTSVDGEDVLSVSVTENPFDTSGSLPVFEADAVGTESRNVVSEIERILTDVMGLTVDSASFSSGVTWATTEVRNVDIAYGRGGERTAGAILGDLLQPAQAHLRRHDDGSIAIVIDKAETSSFSADEWAGEAVQFDSLRRTKPPASVQVKYRPNPANLDEYTHTITRPIAGGGVGEPLAQELPFVRDFETADRYACWLEKRNQYNREGRARIGRRQVAIGDVFTLTSPSRYSGAMEWKAVAIDRPADENELELREYNAAIYTYSASTEPAGAGTGYQPDYSKSPPAAPAFFGNPTTTSERDEEGHVTASISALTTPPTANFQKVIFVLTKASTGASQEITGTAIFGGVYYITTFGGLAPNAAYTLYAYAVSPAGYYSTAISYAITTATDATVPSTLASPTAAQGTGKTIKVFWTKTTDLDWDYYVLQRSVNGGAYTNVDAGGKITDNSYLDRDLSIGSNYAYKVQVWDRAGNSSAFSSASNTVSVAANIGNTEIDGTDKITGSKLTALNADTITTGTITAITFTTSTGTGERILISASSNELQCYDFANRLIGSVGQIAGASDEWFIFADYVGQPIGGLYLDFTGNRTAHVENSSSGTAMWIESNTGQTLRCQKISGSGYTALFYGGGELNVYVDKGMGISGPIRFYNGGTDWVQLECYNANNFKVTRSSGGGPWYIPVSTLPTAPV